MAMLDFAKSGTAPEPDDSATRLLIQAGLFALGVSGLAAGLLGGVSAYLAVAAGGRRPVWGTGEPPEGTAERIAFLSEDGTRICGWFFRCPDAERAPALVLCHGAWTGRRECLPLALRFHRAGYNVLVFDFRAHGESEGDFISVGVHEMKDVLGAVQYLKAQPSVDPSRIGALGFSMGAAAVINAAARCADIAAIVADSGYAVFLDAVNYCFERVGRLPRYPFYPLAKMCAEWLASAKAEQMRPEDVIRKVCCPVFIIHGQEDEIVPVNHAYRLYHAATQPKELWVVPGAWHVGARDLQPEEYFQRVSRFFAVALARQDAAPEVLAA